MTDSPAAAAGGGTPKVRCPTCLGSFQWDEQELFERTELGEFKSLDDSLAADDLKRQKQLRKAYIRCPNPDHDFPVEHYLPLRYLRYRPPLVIGLVGTKRVGKSTLLAAMIDEIDRDGLARYGFTVHPLVEELHEEFRKTRLEQLMKGGQSLDGTPAAEENVEFADAFLLTKESFVQPIAFFDVGGESLAREKRFFQAVNALIFVVDPDTALGRTDGSRDATGRPSSAGDPAFNAVLGSLGPSSDAPAEFLDQAAAIVLAKADTLRFEPPISQWLSQKNGVPATIEADRIRAESRDVYAFLYQCQAEPWLKPFSVFRRCTLHVASATGSEITGNKTYRRGIRPRGVLEPLVAILAMTGVISGPEAAQVGW
jgi:hypothetical protein